MKKCMTGKMIDDRFETQQMNPLNGCNLRIIHDRNCPAELNSTDAALTVRRCHRCSTSLIFHLRNISTDCPCMVNFASGHFQIFYQSANIVDLFDSIPPMNFASFLISRSPSVDQHPAVVGFFFGFSHPLQAMNGPQATVESVLSFVLSRRDQIHESELKFLLRSYFRDSELEAAVELLCEHLLPLAEANPTVKRSLVALTSHQGSVSKLFAVLQLYEQNNWLLPRPVALPTTAEMQTVGQDDSVLLCHILEELKMLKELVSGIVRRRQPTHAKTRATQTDSQLWSDGASPSSEPEDLAQQCQHLPRQPLSKRKRDSAKLVKSLGSIEDAVAKIKAIKFEAAVDEPGSSPSPASLVDSPPTPARRPSELGAAVDHQTNVPFDYSRLNGSGPEFFPLAPFLDSFVVAPKYSLIPDAFEQLALSAFKDPTRTSGGGPLSLCGRSPQPPTAGRESQLAGGIGACAGVAGAAGELTENVANATVGQSAILTYAHSTSGQKSSSTTEKAQKIINTEFYKPYACQHTNCNKRFANKFLLKKHEFIHTGERPHQCPYCCKRFNRKDNLLRHKKTHESNSVMMKRSNRIFDSGESMSPVDDSNLKTLDQFANDPSPPGSCDHERFNSAAVDATNTKLNENEENKQITTTLTPNLIDINTNTTQTVAAAAAAAETQISQGTCGVTVSH
ncbi:putative zinc finger protein [Trichinella pseudospiralis]|uniref:Putative zinc finger protein n=1 Tax=Trichinella pseudospiralis TaxID=6337 RepID=A0A0V1IVK8_TRIPS|nr:putative zinc finger protein [Trichinella pseudospiralis]